VFSVQYVGGVPVQVESKPLPPLEGEAGGVGLDMMAWVTAFAEKVSIRACTVYLAHTHLQYEATYRGVFCSGNEWPPTCVCLSQRVVWCGVVWCGVVWCGVVWRGVVWCGVVWCGVVWCGVYCSVREQAQASLCMSRTLTRTRMRCSLFLPHSLEATSRTACAFLTWTCVRCGPPVMRWLRR
jgi:hypothetical protein